MFGGVIGGATAVIRVPDFGRNIANLFFTHAQDVIDDHEDDLSDAEGTFQGESKDLGEAKRKLEDCLKVNKK
jgi:hypothetical protein